MFNNY